MSEINLLTQRLVDLAPWHMDIPLPNGLNTVIGNQIGSDDPNFTEVSVIRTDELKRQILMMYPNGLAGKRLLDVGCNSGGYCFMANDLKADFAYGFDVRDHWIEQARLVADAWQIPVTNVQFGVHHLHELDSSESFDVTIFKGVFYHLPDPIHALKSLTDVTSETIIVDTDCRSDIPEDCLVAQFESMTHVMSGVDKLCWCPGGPVVLRRMLDWCGFPNFHVISWTRDNRNNEQRPSAKTLSNRGRIRVLASRNEDVIETFIASRDAELARMAG